MFREFPVVLALAALACAGGTAAPPPAPEVNPVGIFDFTSEFQGAPISGSFEITRSETGTYGGWMVTSVTPEVPIVGVTVDGMTLNVEFETPDGFGLFELNFVGDAFTGSWSYLMDSGTMEGSRRSVG